MHQRDDDSPKSKKVKFDMRNPSTLAPDIPEEDAVLEADVIGKGYGATKRGAVNIEGYESDSDNENFNARARQRKIREVDIGKQLDDYDPKSAAAAMDNGEDEVEDEEDMFANPSFKETSAVEKENDIWPKKKSVSFMDPSLIQGVENSSRSGGQVRLDESSESESDEEKIDQAMEEQGIDHEIGRGGLKHHAPKLEAFNMKEEQEEGRFDEDGNYIRKAADPDAVHDNWLAGISKKDVKRAAEAHERREVERRKKRLEDDRILTADLLGMLIRNLERGETTLEALARLGRSQKKNKNREKKVPKWKQKRLAAKTAVVKEKEESETMDVDHNHSVNKDEDIEYTRLREAIEEITEAADRLLGRDRPDIYDQERELLIRDYRRETGEEWVDGPNPPRQNQSGSRKDEISETGADHMWEFRWTDQGQKQGPFDKSAMKAWQDAGYFGEGVEFRHAGSDEEWSRVLTFA